MKRPLGTLALILIAITLSGSLLANDRYGKQKVVYHINSDDPQTQVAALRNVRNHLDAVGTENIELKIVMHGDGVSLVMDPDYLEGTKMKAANADQEMQARIVGLKQRGVAFEVCANTLKGRNIPRDALYDVNDADIVPSGVAELSRLQQMGFTYIKP
ncbi:DsrE family protein [Imhoffiella purpurea]|uniref:Uncharacterized protein n=1 Tax=Imhoffiella purpurea TaxID=1249627 RepID=W9VWX2_9GAMM|nr:DsrE family protein [Imhoffiella purpurea]EXJ14910.1 hypothetical protein D779_2116 [Imhoffiella purpurea]